MGAGGEQPDVKVPSAVSAASGGGCDQPDMKVALAAPAAREGGEGGRGW